MESSVDAYLQVVVGVSASVDFQVASRTSNVYLVANLEKETTESSDQVPFVSESANFAAMV